MKEDTKKMLKEFIVCGLFYVGMPAFWMVMGISIAELLDMSFPAGVAIMFFFVVIVYPLSEFGLEISYNGSAYFLRKWGVAVDSN